MAEQLFINDRVKCVERQEIGFIVGKFRSKKYQWQMFYAVEFDDGDMIRLAVIAESDLIKQEDMPDPPPVKAKVY
jgi:hypothetical protein